MHGPVSSWRFPERDAVRRGPLYQAVKIFIRNLSIHVYLLESERLEYSNDPRCDDISGTLVSLPKLSPLHVTGFISR